METKALTHIEGKFISGHYSGSTSATITIMDKNDESIIYKCNINKLRTPDIYDQLKNIHPGSLMVLNGAKVKNQVTGEHQYIIK